MRYKVQYLRNGADPASLCHERYVYVDTLDEALAKAWEDVEFVQTYKGGSAFQIVDLHEDDQIVARRAWLSRDGDTAGA